jgi:hypothetical protein
MDRFETTAILEDASHLVLHDPVPQPAAKKCRVIVLFEKTEVARKVKSGGRDALSRLAEISEPMGGMSNEEMDRAIYGV